MIDTFTPLSTSYRWEPDYSEADWKRELDQYVERQRAIDRLLHGEEDLPTVLDLLEHQGIDPMLYLVSVEEVTSQIINNGIVVYD